MFTCIECGHKYDANTGDTDERVCNDCLEQLETHGKVEINAPVNILDDKLIEIGLTVQQRLDTLAAIRNYINRKP